jgi:hypothetical protein
MRHPLDAGNLGLLLHQLIGRLLADGVRAPDPLELATVVAHYVARDDAVQSRPTYRQSQRQRLHLGARLYLRAFLPDETHTFIGSEVSAGTCSLDLLWRDAEGQYWADELKTGRTEPDSQQLHEQLGRQLAAGRRKWGAKFLGVRVCLFASPAESFFADVDGDVWTLEGTPDG